MQTEWVNTHNKNTSYSFAPQTTFLVQKSRPSATCMTTNHILAQLIPHLALDSSRCFHAPSPRPLLYKTCELQLIVSTVIYLPAPGRSSLDHSRGEYGYPTPWRMGNCLHRATECCERPKHPYMRISLPAVCFVWQTAMIILFGVFIRYNEESSTRWVEYRKANNISSDVENDFYFRYPSK